MTNTKCFIFTLVIVQVLPAFNILECTFWCQDDHHFCLWWPQPHSLGNLWVPRTDQHWFHGCHRINWNHLGDGATCSLGSGCIHSHQTVIPGAAVLSQSCHCMKHALFFSSKPSHCALCQCDSRLKHSSCSQRCQAAAWQSKQPE
jgi:hypothetical protein